MMWNSKALLALTALVGSAAASPMVSPRADTFTNPVIWEDYPDLDVFRVGDVYYYSSSTFAFSPGAPVLKSYDLVNWTPVTHSVPKLNFGDKYNLPGNSQAYVKGVWASTLRYRKSSDTFIWLGCVEGKTYVWTAAGTNAGNNNGEVNTWNWQSKGTLPRCYYDSGLLIDDDDKMYIAYGNPAINVAQLNADGTAEVKNQEVYRDSSMTLEGSRMYKYKGNYYIFTTRPANAEYVLKSSSPFGPYERKPVVESISGPLANAGYSHQGGLVDTKDGKWYYMAFMDSYPGGRIPVLAPITWTSDGWPQVQKVNNAWGLSYPMPVQTSKTVPKPTGLDTFSGGSLSHEWEFNHNPDTSKFSLGSGGLNLKTASVTNDLFNARNTLTHRILGPKSQGTFRIDISKLADGDRAGAILFRDVSAYIGIHKSGSNAQLVMVNNLNLNTDWTTKSTGTVAATGPNVSGSEIWLRVKADITPAFSGGATRQATFWYSNDGNSWTQLGGNFGLTNTWEFFTGYRFGVFNFATKALGGEVTVKSFTLDTW